MPSEPADALVVDTKSGPDEATLVGASQWGCVYRSVSGPNFYRVLRFDETGLEQIHQARTWIGKPARPQVASIVEVDQSVGSDPGFYYIKYSLDGRDTLIEALRDDDAATRLGAGAKVCEALPTWWLNLGSPVLLTPADVVLSGETGAVILPSPFRPPLDAKAIQRHPERARYLSAERMRGAEQVNPDGEDVFALGGVLLECFYRPVTLEPAEAMTRAASRSLRERDSLEGLLPAWMERLDSVQEARQAAWGLIERRIGPGAPVDLRDLAARLRHCSRRLQPLELVKELHSRQRLAEALVVANEILRDGDDRTQGYEVMVEAAAIASQLGHGLESLEWLERAIAARPAQQTAYALQLEQIGRLEQSGPVNFAGTTGLDEPVAPHDESRAAEVSGKLDHVVRRDFDHLPQDLTLEGRMHFEGIMCRYLLNRGRWAEVRKLIEPRLWEGQTFLFWRFSQRLDDVEALIGLGAIADARSQLDNIEQALRHVEQNRSVSASDIDASRRRLHGLRVRLVATQSGSTG